MEASHTVQNCTKWIWRSNMILKGKGLTPNRGFGWTLCRWVHVLRCMKIQSNIKFYLVGWEVGLMLFTTCYLISFPVYTMPSLPALIHSLKSTCLVYCHTAIQHHSTTYNINDQSLLGSGIYGYSSYMWIVTAFFSWNCLSFMSMERDYLTWY